MPTYEYRCKACSHQLEIVQAFTDDALTTCPSCGAEELRKVFGSVGISFKGSGFYKNDSRSSSTSKSSTSSGDTSTSDTSSGSSSSSSTSDGAASSSTSSSSEASSSASGAKSA